MKNELTIEEVYVLIGRLIIQSELQNRNVQSLLERNKELEKELDGLKKPKDIREGAKENG